MKAINTLLVIAVCLLTAAAVNGQVKSDYDRDTDFTTYETYSFAGWEPNSGEVVGDEDRQRIFDAIRDEMNRRGLQEAEAGGDLVITGYAVLSQETSTTAYNTFTSGLGMISDWGWGRGPGMSGGNTEYLEGDYKLGTIVLDMYDGSSKSLVWQGMEQDIIETRPNRRDTKIPKVIGNVMTEFPISLSN